jgi:hypothetical protein
LGSLRPSDGRSLRRKPPPKGIRALRCSASGSGNCASTKTPAVVGQRLTLNNQPFDVVGVLPESYRAVPTDAPDLYVPLSTVAHGKLRPTRRSFETIWPPRDRTSWDESAQTQTHAAAGNLGHRIGAYRLLQLLAEGGMGKVWLAEQVDPVRRRVAVKVVQSTRWGKPARVRRGCERSFPLQRPQDPRRVRGTLVPECGQRDGSKTRRVCL